MSKSPSSNLLIEIEELGNGSHEDDVPLGDDVYIADEGLANECDDAPDLIGYIKIKYTTLVEVKATSHACPATSDNMQFIHKFT